MIRTTAARTPSLAASLVASAVLAWSHAPLAHAADAEADLRTLFPSRAPVFAGAAGEPVRMPVPADVLSACQSDLSDVRLVDEDGREIPYAVDAGLPPALRTAALERGEVLVEDVRREELAPEGAAHDRLALQYRETYRVRLPSAALPEGEAGAWVLVFGTPRPSFVASVRVEREDGSAVREGSLFRLPNVTRDSLRVPLPGVHADAVLRVIVETRGSFLAPSMHAERTRVLPDAALASVRLEIVERRVEEGATVLEVARPAGLVPDLLRLETTTPLFDRPVEVWDLGTPIEEARIGAERVFRVRGATEDLEMNLLPARGDRLRLRIANGDSPPLDDLVVRAEVREPVLVFAAPARPTFLYFGGGRARRPHYDLAHLLPPPGVALGEGRGSAWLALSERNARKVELGAAVPNPYFRDEPVLAFAMRPASEAEVRAFAWRRPLVVPATREGLARVRLAPEDVAKLRPDLADVRVIDANDRQWPFLLERGASPETVDVPADEPARDGTLSRYELRLPATPVTVDRLVVDGPVAFFDRGYRLVADTGGEERTLARGRLVRRAGDPRPLRIDLPASRVESLRLEVEDGDEAPLPLTFRARLPLADLFVVAPAGDYAVLLGHPDAGAPQYEIARVRNVVLSVEAVEADAGALTANPAFSRAARLAKGKGPTQVALWTVLILAVGALGFLTFRLARAEEDPPAKTGT